MASVGRPRGRTRQLGPAGLEGRHNMISERGIKADPYTIRAILDMSPPHIETEILGFLGRLQYIIKFIVRLTYTCEPIFQLLRKKQPKVWDDQCQQAFKRIREYLLSPLVLVPPMLGRPFMLYFLVLDIVLGCMLAQSELSII